MFLFLLMEENSRGKLVVLSGLHYLLLRSVHLCRLDCTKSGEETSWTRSKGKLAGSKGGCRRRQTKRKVRTVSAGWCMLSVWYICRGPSLFCCWGSALRLSCSPWKSPLSITPCVLPCEVNDDTLNLNC